MRLEIKDLSCRRGDLLVLAGVNFSLNPGAALILRGPNGAGKTTLLRCLAGLDRPVSGSISMPDEASVYSGHQDGLKAQMSVAENLRFWARIFGQTDISAAIEAFDLAPLTDRLAANLSAGQKRRLGLARLVLTARPIWFLDEPTVSLDAENTARFSEIIRRHLATGGMAVMATHIDLGLPESQSLDISTFKPDPAAEANPFLDGEF